MKNVKIVIEPGLLLGMKIYKATNGDQDQIQKSVIKAISSFLCRKGSNNLCDDNQSSDE